MGQPRQPGNLVAQDDGTTTESEAASSPKRKLVYPYASFQPDADIARL